MLGDVARFFLNFSFNLKFVTVFADTGPGRLGHSEFGLTGLNLQIDGFTVCLHGFHMFQMFFVQTSVTLHPVIDYSSIQSGTELYFT